MRKAGDNRRQHLCKMDALRVCYGGRREIALPARHNKHFALVYGIRQSTSAIAQLKRNFIASWQGYGEGESKEESVIGRLVSCLAYPAADNVQHLHDKQLSSAHT